MDLRSVFNFSGFNASLREKIKKNYTIVTKTNTKAKNSFDFDIEP